MKRIKSTTTFEVEIEVSGVYLPYRAATRIDPEEGGYVDDVTVESLGLIDRDFSARNLSHPMGVWRTRSLLDGINPNDPAIQRLFDNILAMQRDAAAEAIGRECEEEAA